MLISFLPLAPSHIELLQRWLKQPHVKAHWAESENTAVLKDKFLTQLPARGVHAFVFEVGGEPIGFIQYYEAYRMGGGWWPEAMPGTFGIDLLIGDEKQVGRGLGPSLIKNFLSFVCGRESVREFIVDPDIANSRAIRAFEKAGFQRVGEITTPNGRAMLMKRAPPYQQPTHGDG
jgi:RimJ/RimL family protein N-acetyltransferase